MTLPPSTANWHWKNKDVTGWARSWFERELPSITIKGDGEEVVSISTLTDMDGDVELGQRKSKLITIYDCKIDLKWSGTAADGTEVTGTLQIPEVSHEITVDGLSDYVFVWSLTTESSPAADALFALAKARLPTALEVKLAEFPSALIDTHGKDLIVSATPSAQPSRGSTPAPPAEPVASSSAVPKPAAANGPTAAKKEKPVNTATVTVNATFMAAADDLFVLLTDEKRIPLWSRAPAQSKPEAGADYSLFAGGVKGTYVSLDRPKEIVQTWALASPSWPSGHTATLTTTLVQSSDSTAVTLALAGVPTGMEDELRRNLEGYYVQGLKSIGYVQLVLSPPQSFSRSGPRHQPQPHPLPTPAERSGYARPLAILLAAMALIAAFAVPLFYQKP